MTTLSFEARYAEVSGRTLVVLVAPYGETTYLTDDPAGERVTPGAFTAGLAGRQQSIPLLRNHDQVRRLGMSRSFTETPDGLVGTFTVIGGRYGDELLDDTRSGALNGVSAGFRVLRTGRGDDGARIIAEAVLAETSMVSVPAYSQAQLLATRAARTPTPPPSRLNWWPTPAQPPCWNPRTRTWE